MGMFRRILLIGGAGVLGAAALAVVQIRVGALFGVSGQLDAFFVGASLPSVLLAIGAAAISSLVVPRLPRGEPAVVARAAGRMAVRATLLGLAAAALTIAAAPLIVLVVGPGLDAETAEQATRVLRIYSLSIPATAAAFAYASYGFASGRVWASGLSTTAYALTWLGLLFVPALSDDVESAALAGLIATAVQVGAAFLLSSTGLPRPRPIFTGLPVSRAGLWAVGAVLGAAIVARAGLLLDPVFGSLLPVGSVSELSYASRIGALAILVCGQGAAFSLLIVGRERSGQATQQSRIGLVAPLVFSTSAAIVLLIGGPALSELILARGELAVDDARAIGELLRLWTPAIVAFTLVWALEALLYAELRTAAVLYRALAGLVVNIAASGLLVLALGIEGRPLGVVVGVAVQLALLVALFWEDERFVVLRARATWRFLALHAATVAAVSLLTYGLFDAAGVEQAGACAVVVVAAAISIAFLRSYRPPAGG
jgi:peptidoglycan biosynthesis protein MviN/MurJ (putative lipid II flippase)